MADVHVRGLTDEEHDRLRELSTSLGMSINGVALTALRGVIAERKSVLQASGSWQGDPERLRRFELVKPRVTGKVIKVPFLNQLRRQHQEAVNRIIASAYADARQAREATKSLQQRVEDLAREVHPELRLPDLWAEVHPDEGEAKK